MSWRCDNPGLCQNHTKLKKAPHLTHSHARLLSHPLFLDDDDDDDRGDFRGRVRAKRSNWFPVDIGR